jgi:autotransporter translocation and assembly factor TamB
MRWRWIILVALLVLLVGVPVAVVHRVLHSEAGLQFVLAQLQRLEGVRIDVTGARGTIASTLYLERLVIDHEAVRIEADDVQLRGRVRGLANVSLQMPQFEAGRVEVTLKRREPQPPSDLHFLPRFLEVEAPEVRLRSIGLELQDGQRFEVASLDGALAMTRWRIVLTDLVIDDPAGRVEGNVTLRARRPLGLSAALNGHWRLPDERTYRFAAAARGNLARLGTTVALAEPANVSFDGNLLSLDEEPRAVGTLRVTDFDGSPWIEAGTWPAARSRWTRGATLSAWTARSSLRHSARGSCACRAPDAFETHRSRSTRSRHGCRAPARG